MGYPGFGGGGGVRVWHAVAELVPDFASVAVMGEGVDVVVGVFADGDVGGELDDDLA